MTPHDTNASNSPVPPDDTGGAGAPEEEMEVTPKMIKAGVEALIDSDERFELKKQIVERIFISMLRAREP